MSAYSSKPNAPVLTALVVVGVLIVVAISGTLLYQFQFAPSSQTAGTSSTAVTNSHMVKIILPQGVGSNTALNFEPAVVTVVIGVNNTILWVDEDSTAPHTVTSSSVPAGAKSFNSGNLVQGDTYELNFTVPGVYKYYCIYHSWMQGTIIVKATPGSSATSTNTTTA